MVHRRSLWAVVGLLAIALAGLTGCEPGVRHLSGQVKIDGTGSAPAGVTVAVYADDAETLVTQTVTNASGAFRIDDQLPAGSYRLKLNLATWYGGTDWATATTVVAGPDSDPLTISIPFTGATVSGDFAAAAEFGGLVRLIHADGVEVARHEIVYDEVIETAFSFGDIAPGSYRLAYRLDVFDAPSITLATPEFEVGSGATVVRTDTFPAAIDTTLFVVAPDLNVADDVVLGVIDEETGQLVSVGRLRTGGHQKLTVFTGRTYRVLAIDRSGTLPTQYLGESEHPGGEVFGPSNPIGDSYTLHA